VTALDLLALTPATASGWALAAAVVVPWLTGLALIATATAAGALALVRAAWRRATGRRPEVVEPEPEHREHEQLLAALAAAVRERDDALRELDGYRRAADVTQEIRLPDDTLTLELTR
jgi:hypothetical protein